MGVEPDVVPGGAGHPPVPRGAASGPAIADTGPGNRPYARCSNRTTIDLDVGVPDVVAVESSGTSALASGKYAAAQPMAVGYDTIRNASARRSVTPVGSSGHSLTRSTPSPSANPSDAR